MMSRAKCGSTPSASVNQNQHSDGSKPWCQSAATSCATMRCSTSNRCNRDAFPSTSAVSSRFSAGPSGSFAAGALYAYCQQRHLCGPAHHDPALAELFGFAYQHRRRIRLTRQSREVTARQGEGLFVRDITPPARASGCSARSRCDRTRAGRAPSSADVVGQADGRKAIRMRDERLGLHLFAQETLVVVIHAQQALGIHDAALALDQRRSRLSPWMRSASSSNTRSSAPRGKPVLVHRHVIAGERVVGTPCASISESNSPAAWRAVSVEHHVFKEMREPGESLHSLRLPTRTQLWRATLGIE